MKERGLGRNELLHRLLQALLELSRPGSQERSLLESIGNHVKDSTTILPPTTTATHADLGWE